MFPCPSSCLFQRKNVMCSASYAVTIVVLFLFNSISLCFGCTSDKHGEAINILNALLNQGLVVHPQDLLFKLSLPHQRGDLISPNCPESFLLGDICKYFYMYLFICISKSYSIDGSFGRGQIMFEGK